MVAVCTKKVLGAFADVVTTTVDVVVVGPDAVVVVTVVVVVVVVPLRTFRLGTMAIIPPI